PEPTTVESPEGKVRIVPRPSPVDLDAIDPIFLCRTRIALRQPDRPVPVADGAAEDFEEVELGAAGFGMARIAPVERDEVQPARPAGGSGASLRPIAPITK